MIDTALITSTIFPPSFPRLDGSKRVIHTSEQRPLQTAETVHSLRLAGISNIYLVDNSGAEWQHFAEDFLAGVIIFRENQSYLYDNKGINELQMILSCIVHLPPSVPILKISGRYRLVEQPQIPLHELWDLAGRLYLGPNGKWFSTRMYVAQTKSILARVVLRAPRKIIKALDSGMI